MQYKLVPYGVARHLIVDGLSSPTAIRVTPNLTENEFKIELLITNDCPIRRSCILIEDGICSLCNHLGPFPEGEKGIANYDEIACLYDDLVEFRRIDELWVEGCVLGKNCAACEDRLTVGVPLAAEVNKSHAYVECSRAHP